jgi:DNA-directed RNA polymerase specialized sigma24 family protein
MNTPDDILALQHEKRDAAIKSLNSGPAKRAAHRVLDPSRFEVLDEQRVQHLLSAMLATDNAVLRTAAAHGLIAQHMSMAWKIASSMRRKLSAASKLGQGPDDLYGSAMLGLVQGVEWVAAGRLFDTNITPYLAVTIRRFVTDYCEADHLVPIDRRALKDYYESKGASGLAVAIDDATVGRVVVSQAEWGIFYEETLSKLLAIDSAIVLGLLQGNTQGEIAAKLGIDRTTVCKRLARIPYVADE